MSEYWRLRPTQEQLEQLQKAIKKYGTQGEIQLPKEDKYEEFKKWFRNQTDISWKATDCAFVEYDDELPFRKFEREQEEKEKEKQIKETIRNSIDKFALERCGIGWINVDIIYKDLKEKDLIK